MNLYDIVCSYRWSLIAGRLPGRTDNEVKNYWNSHLRKKLISMGVDPNNHRLNQIPQRRHSTNDNISTIHIQQHKPKTPPLGKNSRVSDTASCLEDETASSARRPVKSSNLNLELSIAFRATDNSSATYPNISQASRK